MTSILLTGLSVIIFILILGLLIAVHELGHFLAAKKCGIRVHEFALGMGPKIWKRQRGETLYSLRAFPIGGFCAMQEDEEADPGDPHAFPNAKRRYRALVLAAGSIMNFLLGFVILLGVHLFLPAGSEPFIEPVVIEVHPESDLAGLFQPNDRITGVDGHRIFNRNNALTFLMMGAGEPYDFEVQRDGETVVLRDVVVNPKLFDNETQKRFGFSLGVSKTPTLGHRLENTLQACVDDVRMVWASLGMLIRGKAGVDDLMGPVGMGGVVNNIVQQEAPAGLKLLDILNFAALITINLAVMNLLPLPALDGGRLLFLGVEAVRRKPNNPKFEGYIHAAGMILFFALMIFVFYNDILRAVGLKALQ